MIPAHLPCMFFSSDGHLVDEKGILSVTEDILTLAELEQRFIRSLCGDSDDFTDFCRSDSETDYRLYRVRCFSSYGTFRYAFCEKAAILGGSYAVVYLAHGVSAFHSLMSPSSVHLVGSTDTLTSELMKIKSSADSGASSLSAEAFSVASRIPNLCEAIFEPRSRARYCDLLEVTRYAADKIASAPAFSASFDVGVRRGAFSKADNDTENIIEMPVEAYAAVLTALSHAAASLSSTHSLGVTVSYYSYAADVEITTVTEKLTESVRLASPRYLEAAGVRADFLRIAEIIAYIAGIDLSVSFDNDSGVLKIVIGLGYEMQSIPDFKFSDPFEFIEAVTAEIGSLLASV